MDMIYTLKVQGDWLIGVEDIKDVRQFIKENLMKLLEMWKGVEKFDVVTDFEDIPTKKGEKFKFKAMVLNGEGLIEIYKFNVWYGRKSDKEVRVKWTVRGPVRPDVSEIKFFGEKTGNKEVLEVYQLV